MSCLFKFAFSALVLAYVLGQQPKPFANLGYLGKGYNIAYGNPRPTKPVGVDPGFMQRIFNLSDYSQGHTTADKKWILPNGVQALPCDACTMDFTSESYTGLSSYVSALEEDVTGNFKGFGFSFSASVDYKDMQNTTKSKTALSETSYVACCVYTASWDYYSPPLFYGDFAKAIADMPLSYTKDMAWFQTFIKQFGTHIAQSIRMGGKFGQRSNFASSSYSRLESSNLNIKVSAGYAGKAITAAASTMTSQQKAMANAYSKARYNQHTFEIGCSIPKSGNTSDWISACQDFPMPMGLSKMIPVSQLLTKQFFPKDSQIAMKQTALGDAYTAYCNYLKSLGVISSCNPPGADPGLPPASIFGGVYTQCFGSGCGEFPLKEQPNPYTKQFNCPVVMEAYEVSTLASVNFGGVDAKLKLFACFQPDKLRSGDPLHFVGGMFNQAPSSSDSHVNPLTQSAKCPSGFTQTTFSRGNFVPGGNGVSMYCFNSSLLPSPDNAVFFGGFYQLSTTNDPTYSITNVYTKAFSCPDGYQTYKIVDTAASEADVFRLFICLNNVFSY